MDKIALCHYTIFTRALQCSASQIFFQSSFMLEDPKTFHTVIPWSKLVFCNDVTSTAQGGAAEGGASSAAVTAVAGASQRTAGHKVSLMPAHGTAKLLEEQVRIWKDVCVSAAR